MHTPSVATLREGQRCRALGGRIPMDWVATFPWTGWQLSCGLGGRIPWNTQRLEHCDCTRRKTASFRPLAALLTESVAPELLYMEAKWSSLVSYGLGLDALQ